MSYDGIVMRAVALELNEHLPGARIDKIYQPTQGEIVLVIRQRGQNYKLLLSAHPQEARVHLVTQTKPNPTEPPLFCMVLRKHLEGGRILSVTQKGLERILEISCEIIDDLGDKAERRLLIEVMGKHSNIILLEPTQRKILDAAYRITPAISRHRQILPGLTYQTPPAQDKIIPWEVNEEAFVTKLLALPLSQSLSKALLNTYSGFGPQTAQEIVHRAGLEPTLALEYCGEYELNKLWQVFAKISQDIQRGSFTPEVVMFEDKSQTFSALALTHFPIENRRSFASINEALDFYYSFKEQTNLFQQKKGDLERIIKKEIERCEKKAGLQESTVLEGQETEKYRLWGELLMAHMYQLEAGPEVTVTNYYDPEAPSETIPLDPDLSILDNAKYFFNKYQKAKHAAKIAEEHLRETREELAYLASILTSLESVSSLPEIEEIKEELREAGYLKKAEPSKKKAPAPKESTPEKVLLEGWEILFGKNNKQNDLLTMKIAKPEDLWFHTKDIPGSHIIIKNPQGKNIPEKVLEKAALLAAFHSRARHSTHVPVDYTLRKNVRKPKGSKPGMVIYDNQKTVYVTPQAELIKEILK